MEEEIEVDILGDFDLTSFSSKISSEIRFPFNEEIPLFSTNDLPYILPSVKSKSKESKLEWQKGICWKSSSNLLKANCLSDADDHKKIYDMKVEVVKKADHSSNEEMEIDVEGDGDTVSSMMIPQDIIPKATFTDLHPKAVPLAGKWNHLIPIQGKCDIQEKVEKKLDLQGSIDEIVWVCSRITSEEKEFFPEFFSYNNDSPIKRYLEIKSHIIRRWSRKRPSHLTKAQARIGLENFRDNNLINRIHTYLEMKGLINFRCNKYLRKQESSDTMLKETECKISFKNGKDNPDQCELQDEISSAVGYGEGGLTLMHDSNGSVSKIVVTKYNLNQMINVVDCKKKLRKKSNFRKEQLTSCKCFSLEYTAPFQLQFYLEALLIADIHSYSSCQSIAVGLFRGWYDSVNHMLHVTSCAPIGTSGLSSCTENSVSFSDSGRLENEQLIVGWYFSYPAFSESSAINQTVHSDLQALFTKNTSDPFIMLALSPFSRKKSRCITILERQPYSLDFSTVLAENMCLIDIKKKMKGAVLKGSNEIQFNKKYEHLNNKTCGQLCYESVRRLLDSSVNSIPFEIKEALIKSTQDIVDFNRTI